MLVIGDKNQGRRAFVNQLVSALIGSAACAVGKENASVVLIPVHRALFGGMRDDDMPYLFFIWCPPGFLRPDSLKTTEDAEKYLRTSFQGKMYHGAPNMAVGLGPRAALTPVPDIVVCCHEAETVLQSPSNIPAIVQYCEEDGFRAVYCGIGIPVMLVVTKADRCVEKPMTATDPFLRRAALLASQHYELPYERVFVFHNLHVLRCSDSTSAADLREAALVSFVHTCVTTANTADVMRGPPVQGPTVRGATLVPPRSIYHSSATELAAILTAEPFLASKAAEAVRVNELSGYCLCAMSRSEIVELFAVAKVPFGEVDRVLRLVEPYWHAAGSPVFLSSRLLVTNRGTTQLRE